MMLRRGLVRASDGAIVAQYGFDPYGPEDAGSVDTVTNPLKFAAREYDAEDGLYYMRARYYDPMLERFASEDPVGLAGGMNLYTYANDDPINGRDPSGNFASGDRGPCSLLLTTCPGEMTDLDVFEWEAAQWASQSGGGTATVTCKTETAADCDQVLSAFLYALQDAFGSDKPKRFEAPDSYTARFFWLNFEDDLHFPHVHHFYLKNASFVRWFGTPIVSLGNKGVLATYQLVGSSYTGPDGATIEVTANRILIRSTLVYTGFGYVGTFEQWGDAYGFDWGAPDSP